MSEKQMSMFDAVMICEGVTEVETEEEVLVAWQYLVDTGIVWSLQGSFGRAAQRLIAEGLIVARKDHLDA